MQGKVNFNDMVNKDSILILAALGLLVSSVLYSAVKVRMQKKAKQKGETQKEDIVKVTKAGVRPAPEGYDPCDEESGFTPLEVSEAEFEREPLSALEEYLDPDTPESRRSALTRQLQDAGYDLR